MCSVLCICTLRRMYLTHDCTLGNAFSHMYANSHCTTHVLSHDVPYVLSIVICISHCTCTLSLHISKHLSHNKYTHTMSHVLLFVNFYVYRTIDTTHTSHGAHKTVYCHVISPICTLTCLQLQPCTLNASAVEDRVSDCEKVTQASVTLLADGR